MHQIDDTRFMDTVVDPRKDQHRDDVGRVALMGLVASLISTPHRTGRVRADLSDAADGRPRKKRKNPTVQKRRDANRRAAKARRGK